jgi:hypothetical protein
MLDQPSFIIEKHEKIATMGSCFAQHVSTLIQDLGLNYFVADSNLGSKQEGIGIFSARYGNVYTVRQAIQLLETLENDNISTFEIWKKNQKFIDSFRPTAIPNGFSTISELQQDRQALRNAIAKVVSEMDVFVYTLGLTEGWMSQSTGQVYPLAPGVSAGHYDSRLHASFNDDYNSLRSQMVQFFTLLRKRNSQCKVILTVSPVPLAATHSSMHVLSANQYSKSLLRVIAQEICAEFHDMYYFPSYEIIVGLSQPGNYFESNLREVSPRGVKHAMRIFSKHFIGTENSTRNQGYNLTKEETGSNGISNGEIQCDENLIYSLEKNENDKI